MVRSVPRASSREITTKTTYTFDKLNTGTNYNIVVKVEDNAGNVAQLMLDTKTTEPIYIIKNGKMLLGSPKIIVATDKGSQIYEDEGFVYCDLFMPHLQPLSIYWTIQNATAGSKVNFLLDNPEGPYGYSSNTSGGYVFASSEKAKPVGGENGYFGGEQCEFAGSNRNFFTGARKFSVDVPANGTVYVGVQAYLHPTANVGHTIVRIYDAWIE